MLGGRFGDQIVAVGAVGELFPIVAIAVFLSAKGQFVGLVSLLIVALLTVPLSYVPRLFRD
jgi:hypothetical protein